MTMNVRLWRVVLQVWQHCDCVGVSSDVESYLCDMCAGKTMSGEVPMIPPPADGISEYKYYLSLEHNSIHVAVGDAVLMTPSDPSLGIYAYRIERLWKDNRCVRGTARCQVQPGNY